MRKLFKPVGTLELRSWDRPKSCLVFLVWASISFKCSIQPSLVQDNGVHPCFLNWGSFAKSGSVASEERGVDGYPEACIVRAGRVLMALLPEI